MKKTLAYVCIISFVLAFIGSSAITQFQLDSLISSGEIQFGPQPNVFRNNYFFDGIQSAFDNSLNLKKISSFEKKDFQNLILATLDLKTRNLLIPHIEIILETSMNYQVDPFWVISIMMVESNFITTSISSKNAHGLMQIKPDTASHLYQLMNKKISEEKITSNLFKNDENIEIGVFYLKKLLQNFRLNYQSATVAYNIGPNKLKNLILEDQIDLGSFQYYLEVKSKYQNLIKQYKLISVTEEIAREPHGPNQDHPQMMLDDKDYLTSLNQSINSEILESKYLHSLSF